MELHLILLFMIFASFIAVEMKDLISSVIALSAVGLGLCMAFLILKAPGLAITQLVVEILCIILLIRATINKDLAAAKDGRWFFNTVVTAAFIAGFLLCSFFALRQLPRFGEPLMRGSGGYFVSGAQAAGFSNIVSAITLNFRSYDTLAEAAILFAAVIGALAVTRRTGRVDDKQQ